MDKGDVINEVAIELQKFQLELPKQQYTREQLQQKIASRINYLIPNNFSLLISLLYRLDISEDKLKHFLDHLKDVGAADIIASMIIERQLQKIASRTAFKGNEQDINEDEKW